jgi:Spy/CpxP family protein refolding chaperone
MMMGGGGMGGGILGLLLRSVPLQEELGFTPDQKAQIQEINTNAREKMRDLTRDMFQQGGRGQGGRNNNGGQQGGGEQGGQRPNFDPQQFERMQTAFTEMREENDTALKRVLTPKQLKRLNEIRLRILDAFAVAEEDVANDIGLNEEQYAKILEIMEQYDQANFALLREQFQGMGNMFGRGGPGGGGPGGADNARGGPQAPGARGRQNTVNTKGARDDGDGEETPAARPGARSGRAQQQPAEDGDEEPVPARGANRGRGAAGGRGGAAGAAGAGQDAVADGEQPQGGRRGGFNITPEQRDEMNKRISELSAKQDDLDKKAFAAIRKELLAAQRSKFNKMLGADFDLSKLTQTPEWPQGGRRGEDANAGDRTTNGRAPGARPAAKAAESDDEADEAPAKSETPKQQPRSRPQPRVRGGTNSGGQ